MVIDIQSKVVKVEIYEIDYEYEQTIKTIEEAGFPQEFANIIRTGNALIKVWDCVQARLFINSLA